MKKNIKMIILTFLLLIVGIIIGVLSTYIILNTNKKEETPTIEKLSPEEVNKDLRVLKSLKVSPYTLDELYEIVETPEKYYEANSTNMNAFNYVMFNFYNFFNTKTPVKVATKVRKEGTKIVEVLEVEYIDYSEYQRRMADFYEFHRVHIEEEKEAGEEPGYTTPYRFFIEEFLYGNAEIVE